MWKVNLVVGSLIVGGAVHMIVALMALINFMWWTAAVATVVAIACISFVDQLEKEFYR